MSAPLVVSVGMTHPQNVAGLGVDIRVAAQYGVRHAMVVAAISAQDETGVQAVMPLPRDFVRKQLQAAGIGDAAAVRVGALGTCEHFELLDALFDRTLVVDPVMRSSAGGSLYVDDPVPALRGLSAGTGTIITPNIDEAHIMTGIAIHGIDDMIAAGTLLTGGGCAAALIKGGHLHGEPIDVLVSGGEARQFTGARLPQTMRGTGCTLAIALACELALGRDLVEAVKGARAFVRANIARS
jgi:hydroxymethylpyrimidine kinase/phosphomethylpyrimidine kinase